MPKKYIAALLLGTNAFVAAANSYYMVTPLGPLQDLEEPQLLLKEASLPASRWSIPYSFNFSEILEVSTESKKSIQWSITSSDPNLKINSTTGAISGVAQSATPITVTVTAKIGKANASNTYTIPIKHGIALSDGVKGWSDGSAAPDCKSYLNPSENYEYIGESGDGIYRIQTGANSSLVYCDMTRDGGGWMLAYNQKGSHTAFMAKNSEVVTLSAAGSHKAMQYLFESSAEFRWTDPDLVRFLQGRTHMPTWYSKLNNNVCGTNGVGAPLDQNTIQVYFEGGWFNTSVNPRTVEACIQWPFGMRNNGELSNFRDVAGYNNTTSHMCWFSENLGDRPFADSHDNYSPEKSYCTQFGYNFPTSAGRNMGYPNASTGVGSMDYMIWVR